MTYSFHQNFVQVYENDPAGTRVGDLSASDEDKGQRLSYTLVESDNGMFTIVGNQLRKAKSADYETTKVHKVRVRVTDNGSPPAWVSDKAVCTAWLLRVVTPSFKQNLLRTTGGVKRSDWHLVETGMLSAKKTLR